MHAIRRRLTREDGLSLVEMLVALVVLMITIFALSTSLVTSLQALVSNEARTGANAVANEALENLQAADWLVIIPDLPDPDPEPGIETYEVTVDSVDYTVTERIEWVNDPETFALGDYLQFTVTVEWELLTRTRSVTHSAFRAPPAQLSSGEIVVRSVRADPELGLLKQAGVADHGKVEHRVVFNTEGEAQYESVANVQLTLVTTAPLPSGSTVRVSFVARNGSTVNGTLASVDGGETWTVTGDGNWRFRNGDTTFNFTIDLPNSPTLEVTKVAWYVHKAVEIDDGDPVADVGAVCLNADRTSTHPVELTAHFRGLAVDDVVEVSGAGLPSDPPEVAAFESATNTGGNVEYTIAAGHTYPEDPTTTVTMTATRWFDPDPPDGTDSGTVTLSLFAPGDAGYEEACEDEA